MICFTVPGKPCAKQSLRFTQQGRRYQPKEVVEYRSRIALFARQAHVDVPLEGPVCVEVTACFQIPRSWSKKRRAVAVHHAQRPDPDNLAKAVLDGIKGVIFYDDCQVADLRVIKVWVTTGDALKVRVLPFEGEP